MNPLVLIAPGGLEQENARRMAGVIAPALAGREVRFITAAHELVPLENAKILFAVALNRAGFNPEYYRMLEALRTHRLFSNCAGAVVVDGRGEMYTKTTARELVLAANRSGCALIGRPLVEATGQLRNFHLQAQLQDMGTLEAYRAAVADLVARLVAHAPPAYDDPELLVIHASSHESSNTYALWDQLIRPRLPRWEVTEIGLRNGAVVDCSGCPYTMCLHFGERGECFYGGVVAREAYPAIQRCSAMLLLCPNYNDSLSANLTAFVNRLTAIFRVQRFYEKSLLGIIVSGYSGGDILARQLISGLNMNKSFYLPPDFCMMETANEAGSIFSLEDIETRAGAFAKNINRLLSD